MATVQVTSLFGLPFCDTFVISHLFCDVTPLLNLACTDTTVNEIINFIVSVCVLVLHMGLIFISYDLIICTILKIASTEGRKKASATCTSRLIVVISHYGCISIVYLKLKSQSFLGEEQTHLCDLHHYHSPAELCHVQPEEQELKDALCRAMKKKLFSVSRL